MSVKSILGASPGLREHRTQSTPQHLEELLDELDTRMAVRVVDPSEPPVPVGRFEAVMHLGSGGYGSVVEAWDPELERAVALKLCVNDKPAATKLLLAEAKTLARLQHPNIITVHETGRYHGSLFLVMEFASGGSLTRRALEAERMSWRRLVPIFAKVARGLAAAHGAGVVHGDLKPSNILLHGDGRPCIADFGLARITGAAPLLPNAIGTLLYAAPEVLDGGEPDPRSDQWSLFVTLWECLDRRLPFISNKGLRDKLLELTEPGMSWLIKRWPGPSTLRSDVPESLREILVVGLSLDPRERFSSMHAVADALDQVIAYDRVVAFREVDLASDLRLVTLGVNGEEEDKQIDVPPRRKHERAKDALPDLDEVELVLPPPADADSGSSRRPWALSLIGGLLFGAGVFAASSYSHLSQPWASAMTEQTRDEQRPADGADEPLPAKETPCVIGDVPIEPDTSVQAVCRALRVDGYQAAGDLWDELMDSREQKAKSPQDWLKLVSDTTVVVQTLLREADTATPEQAVHLRAAGKRLALFAQDHLSVATNKETAEAVSQVRSIIDGIINAD